jgi:hypothetical protein
MAIKFNKWTLCLGLILVSVAQGQETSCPVGKVVNRDGWNVPGKTSRAKSLLNRRYQLADGTLVDLQIKKLGSVRSSMHIFSCVDNVLHYRSQPVLVREVWKLSSKGRVFAYVVAGDWLAWDEGTRKYVELGSTSSQLFIDQEGNGDFTLMSPTRKGDALPLTVPNWVIIP